MDRAGPPGARAVCDRGGIGRRPTAPASRLGAWFVARSPLSADPHAPSGSAPSPDTAEASSDAASADPGSRPSAGARPSGGPKPGGEMGEVVGDLLGRLFRRGKVEVERATRQARERLTLRQLRQDRDRMYQKLGKESRHLLEGGEIEHPGLARAVERIKELEAKIVEQEDQLRAVGIDPATAGDGGPTGDGSPAGDGGGTTGS